MMIDREGNVSEECASAAARKVPGATIVGKCMPGYSCGIASMGFLGGRKTRKTKRKKGGILKRLLTDEDDFDLFDRRRTSSRLSYSLRLPSQ